MGVGAALLPHVASVRLFSSLGYYNAQLSFRKQGKCDPLRISSRGEVHLAVG